MDRIGWIRGEWHSREDNLLLASLLGQTHVFNIDPSYPHSVRMFWGIGFNENLTRKATHP